MTHFCKGFGIWVFGLKTAFYHQPADSRPASIQPQSKKLLVLSIAHRIAGCIFQPGQALAIGLVQVTAVK